MFNKNYKPEDVREVLGVTDINTIRTNYQRKWLENLERIPEN
jgi:hypothetical protein